MNSSLSEEINSHLELFCCKNRLGFTHCDLLHLLGQVAKAPGNPDPLHKMKQIHKSAGLHQEKGGF